MTLEDIIQCEALLRKDPNKIRRAIRSMLLSKRIHEKGGKYALVKMSKETKTTRRKKQRLMTLEECISAWGENHQILLLTP